MSVVTMAQAHAGSGIYSNDNNTGISRGLWQQKKNL